MAYEEIMRVAWDAALEAGDFVKNIRLSGELQLTFKGERDLLTAADIGAEERILNKIRAFFPDHQIIAEESNPGVNAAEVYRGPLWIVDPVDGTTNFVQGLPHVGVSVAFADEGKLRCGVVAAPFLGEVFSAVQGGGAYCNQQRIAATTKTNIREALIGTGFPYARDNITPIVRRIEIVLKNCRDIRRLGAASLDICSVACGRLDAYYETVQAWDLAGGCIVAREAGAEVGHVEDLPPEGPIPADLCGENLLVAGAGIFHDLRNMLRLNPARRVSR